MNRYLIIIIIFLTICVFSGRLYACTLPPVAVIYPSEKQYYAVGSTDLFDASYSYDPDNEGGLGVGISCYLWGFWNGYSWQAIDMGPAPDYASYYIQFPYVGQYKVGVFVRDDDELTEEHFWDIDHWDLADCQVVVVNIDEMYCKIGSDWSGVYSVCPNPLVVAKGTDITFNPIPDPFGLPIPYGWPDGKPTWKINNIPSGTGYKKTVSFDTASSNPTDYKTVEAECGNTIKINVVVVDLASRNVLANRVSGPVGPAEASYPMWEEGEHIELGATFQFDLNMGPWPTPVVLKCEIWDLDWFDEIIAQGWGPSITKEFGTGGHDDGDCDVKFYVDNNEDSDYDSSDPHKNSPEFKAQTLTNHELDFAYSSLVTEIAQADITTACTTATNRILRKDSWNNTLGADNVDFRATAEFIGTLLTPAINATGGSPPALHDPVRFRYNGSTYNSSFYGDWAYFTGARSADVYIVKGLIVYDEATPPKFVKYLGGAAPHGGPAFVAESEIKVDTRTLVHELGHVFGLDHTTVSTSRIMYEDPDADADELAQYEVDNYEP